MPLQCCRCQTSLAASVWLPLQRQVALQGHGSLPREAVQALVALLRPLLPPLHVWGRAPQWAKPHWRSSPTSALILKAPRSLPARRREQGLVERRRLLLALWAPAVSGGLASAAEVLACRLAAQALAWVVLPAQAEGQAAVASAQALLVGGSLFELDKSADHPLALHALLCKPVVEAAEAALLVDYLLLRRANPSLAVAAPLALFVAAALVLAGELSALVDHPLVLALLVVACGRRCLPSAAGRWLLHGQAAARVSAVLEHQPPQLDGDVLVGLHLALLLQREVSVSQSQRRCCRASLRLLGRSGSQSMPLLEAEGRECPSVCRAAQARCLH